MDKIKCVGCGATITDAGKFCPHCSEPLVPKCPECGELSRPGAKFCEQCGAKMVSDAGTVKTGRWVCAGEEIVNRIEETDLENRFKRGLVIEPGNKAALTQEGRFAGILEGGFYNVSIARRLASWANLSVPTIIHVFNAGDIRMDFDVDGLYSSEQLSVTVSGNVVLTIEHPERFIANLVRTAQRFTTTDIAEFLQGEMRQLLEPLVWKQSVKDLYANETLRGEIEQKAEDDLRVSLDRNGLRLVQLRFVRYACSEMDKMREMYPDMFLEQEQETVEQKREELRKRILSRKGEFYKFTAELSKDKLLTDQQVEQLERAIQEEKDNYALLRDFFVRRTRIVNAQECQQLIDDFRRAKAEADAESEKKVKDTEVKGEVDREKYKDEAEIDTYAKWQTAVAEARDRKLKSKSDYIAALSELGPAAMIAGVGDTERAEMIKELRQTEAMKDMTEEQILAMFSKDSVHAAQTLSEKFKSAGQEQMKEMYERMLSMTEDQSARIERMFAAGMQSHQAPGTTVVSAGGLDGGGAVIVCSSCNTRVQNPGKVCPECGRPL